MESEYYIYGKEKHKKSSHKKAMQKWHEKNPDYKKKYNDEYRTKNKNKIQIYEKTRWKNRSIETVERNKKYHQKNRLKILSILGNKCNNPFNIDHSAFEQNLNYIRCLQIDHVNGGGTKALGKDPYKEYKRILKEIENGSYEYQLLCANCNWIKKHVKNENVGDSKMGKKKVKGKKKK